MDRPRKNGSRGSGEDEDDDDEEEEDDDDDEVVVDAVDADEVEETD